MPGDRVWEDVEGAGIGREWRIASGHEETPELDCDNGFTVVYICQNLSDAKL